MFVLKGSAFDNFPPLPAVMFVRGQRTVTFIALHWCFCLLPSAVCIFKHSVNRFRFLMAGVRKKFINKADDVVEDALKGLVIIDQRVQFHPVREYI